jgi:hypothetical protein
MIKKLFALIACMTIISVLTACASPAGSPTPAAGSDALSGSSEDGPAATNGSGVVSTVAPADVVTLDDSGVSMRVLWTISGYVLGKGFTGDENAVKALLFKPLDINDTQIIFDGQVCKEVTFQKTTVNSSDYLSSAWQVTQKTLGIDFQELQVIKTNCSLSGFQEYMRLGDGRLIVPFNGVFYFFEPAVNK